MNRFPFTVGLTDDEATVSMQYGGIVRCRQMPLAYLAMMAETCRRARKDFIEPFKGTLSPEELAKIDDCIVIGEGSRGPMTVRICVVGNGGEYVFCIAFSDAEDDDDVVFVFVDEQIEEFIRKAKAILPRTLEPCRN